MKRPVAFLCGFYAFGIMLGKYLEPHLLFLLLLLLALLLTAYLLYRRTKRHEWFIALPFVVVGIIAVNLQKETVFDSLEGKRVSVGGVVSDIYITDYDAQIITVKASKLSDGDRVIKYNKKIRVTAYDTRPLIPGQLVTATGTAERLDFKRNPGGFSESDYMRARGFGGKLRNAEIMPMAGGRSADYFFAKASGAVSASFYERLPEHMAGLMCAMILGDSSGLSDEINQLFRNTGISHILSISGLHLSLAAMLVFELSMYVGLKIRGRAALTIGIVWLYCVFTGASVASVRAAVMTSFIMLGYILYRNPDLFSALSIAALLILLKQPLFLWDAGFLLSFSAVFGIGYLSPVIRLRLKRLDFGQVKISGYISATAAATIFTLPVSAYFFYYFSAVGIFVNLLIMPLSSLLIGAGLLFMLIGVFFATGVIASVLYTILKYIIFVAEAFDKLPFSVIITGQPKLYNIALYYGFIILGALALRERREGINKGLIKAAAVSAVLFLILNAKSVFPGNELEIAFLDVRQGDAAVLHLPDKTTIMIDGGGELLRDIGENTGERVVWPYLKSRGETTVNAIFLTHPDFDHSAGVIEIMSLAKVNRLFISDVNMDDAVLDMVLEAAKENGVPVTRIMSGYSANIGGVRIDCVYPAYKGRPKDINNTSLTLKITHGENSFLFTGDIEKPDEEKILLSGADIKSDILKVPHHGASTSSSDEFVKAAAPRYALVGTGKYNSFGHPTEETIQVYEKNNVKLYNTAKEGAIIIESNGREIDITTLREEARRWSN